MLVGHTAILGLGEHLEDGVEVQDLGAGQGIEFLL